MSDVNSSLTVVIVIIVQSCSASVSGPCQASTPRRITHPEGITVRVGLGRLSMQLMSATWEDGVIRRYKSARSRIRDEERLQTTLLGVQLAGQFNSGSNPEVPPPGSKPAGRCRVLRSWPC